MMSMSSAAVVPGGSPASLRSPGASPDGHTAYASSTFVPQSPSHWVHDSARYSCKTCHTPFSFFVRRHHCRFCRDVFCDGCSDYRLLAKDPKDRSVIISVRACRSCFDQCKGRKRRGPIKVTPRKKPVNSKPPLPTTTTTSTTTTTTTTSLSKNTPSLPPIVPPKDDTETRAMYYVKRQPSHLQTPLNKGEVQTEVEEEEEEDEEGESSEGSDDVIVEDEEEFDYSFPIPSPSPVAPFPVIHEDPALTKDASPAPSQSSPISKSLKTQGLSFEGKGDDSIAPSVDKDEFERGTGEWEGRATSEARLTPREAEVLNIPADALASVRGANGAGWGVGEMAVVKSEEGGYEERNVVKRHIVPPSPITGVHDLLDLTSPSAVPQPLLNALNAPTATPEVISDVVEKLGGGQRTPGSKGVKGPAFTPRTGSLLEKAATKPPAPLPSKTDSQGDAADLSSTGEGSTGSDAIKTTNEGKTFLPPSVAPAVAPVSATELVDTVMEGARLTHPTDSSSNVEANSRSSPPPPASNVHKEPNTFVFSPAEAIKEGEMEGMGVGGKRYVVKRRRVVRPVTLMSRVMRPVPLAMLGLGFLLLFALLPLLVTIPLVIALVSLPLLYSHAVGPRVPSAPLSLSRDFPELAAEHTVLLKQRELVAWDRADQRMDGLAALPSPSLTQQYASQTETEMEVPVQGREENSTAMGGQVERKTRPRVVI